MIYIKVQEERYNDLILEEKKSKKYEQEGYVSLEYINSGKENNMTPMFTNITKKEALKSINKSLIDKLKYSEKNNEELMDRTEKFYERTLWERIINKRI